MGKSKEKWLKVGKSGGKWWKVILFSICDVGRIFYFISLWSRL